MPYQPPTLRAVTEFPDIETLLRDTLEQMNGTYTVLGKALLKLHRDTNQVDDLTAMLASAHRANEAMLSYLRHPTRGGV